MSILNRIVNDTKALVASRKRQAPIGELERRPEFIRATHDFHAALKRPGLAFIAEIKKASPSKGLIRPDFDPVQIADQYARNGAEAISVLTEPLHFQGGINYLSQVRATTELPLLRKDFIIDPYQLVEARAYGADAVLLIAAVLDRRQLYDLHQAAEALDLACLVEIYDAAELDRVDFDQVSILGVNNRDLHTFEVDLSHSAAIFRRVPAGVIKVSESGINSSDDLRYLKDSGSDAVLIGETFMRADDPGALLRTIRTALHESSTPAS